MKKTLFLVLLVLLVIIGGCEELKKEIGDECTNDEECVPATCCHPSECVPISQEPDCSGIMCSAVCEPGTMDCGQGKCVCDDGICKAIIVELL